MQTLSTRPTSPEPEPRAESGERRAPRAASALPTRLNVDEGELRAVAARLDRDDVLLVFGTGDKLEVAFEGFFAAHRAAVVPLPRKLMLPRHSVTSPYAFSSLR